MWSDLCARGAIGNCSPTHGQNNRRNRAEAASSAIPAMDGQDGFGRLSVIPRYTPVSWYSAGAQQPGVGVTAHTVSGCASCLRFDKRSSAMQHSVLRQTVRPYKHSVLIRVRKALGFNKNGYWCHRDCRRHFSRCHFTGTEIGLSDRGFKFL